jgi:hypothetical protein
VTTFGDYPFLGDSKLTAINVDPTNPILKSVSGVLYSKDGTRLIEYPDGKTDTKLVIPTGVITGTPSSAASPIIYTITGYNAFGSASITYALTVTRVPVPDPVQQSKISGITPTTGVAGTPVTVTASGNFVEKISAIQIDGIGIAVGSWTQTPTSVTFTIPTKSAGSYSVQIYNGSAPVLAAQRFTVTAVPIPASLNPVPKQKKIYISCANPGHGTRIAYSVNPFCPAGYVKR